MLLARVAEVSREVAAASARSRKIRLLAELFAEAEAEESPLVIAYLSGRLPQGRIGVGWSVLKEVVPPAVPPAERPGLTLGRVDETMTELAAVAGAGSRAERTRLVHALFAAATDDEQ
ncbi:ATP-dependent DNA ligase, partial [Streptomyces massasporeus]